MKHENSGMANEQAGLMASHAEEEGLIKQAIQLIEQKLVQGVMLTSSAVVKQYCQLQIAGERDECFCCLFLNSQHALIKFERLFKGTIDGANVYPRVVVRRALELNAAAVIFTHNHPSGVSEPSSADYGITNRLKESLALIDVRVLDHIVVGAGGTYSMAEQGKI